MKNNRKKVMILTNHSYMLYRFRKELIEELMKNYDVVLSMPFVGHHEDFINMGLMEYGALYFYLSFYHLSQQFIFLLQKEKAKRMQWHLVRLLL